MSARALQKHKGDERNIASNSPSLEISLLMMFMPFNVFLQLLVREIMTASMLNMNEVVMGWGAGQRIAICQLKERLFLKAFDLTKQFFHAVLPFIA